MHSDHNVNETEITKGTAQQLQNCTVGKVKAHAQSPEPWLSPHPGACHTRTEQHRVHHSAGETGGKAQPGHPLLWPRAAEARNCVEVGDRGKPNLLIAAPGRAGPSPSPPAAPPGPSPCHLGSHACRHPPVCPGKLAGPREDRLGMP